MKLDQFISLGKNLIIFSYYLLAGYGLVQVLTWSFDIDPVIQLAQGESSLVSAAPVDTIVFSQPIKKLKECPGTVTRYLTGQCGLFRIQDYETVLDRGDHVIKTSVELPLSLLPGSCAFNAKFTYRCNPLDLIFQRKNYSSPPIQFLVRSQS